MNRAEGMMGDRQRLIKRVEKVDTTMNNFTKQVKVGKLFILIYKGIVSLPIYLSIGLVGEKNRC